MRFSLLEVLLIRQKNRRVGGEAIKRERVIGGGLEEQPSCQEGRSLQGSHCARACEREEAGVAALVVALMMTQGENDFDILNDVRGSVALTNERECDYAKRSLQGLS